MRIWHLGAAASPYKVCGVNTTIWQVAKEQAQLGHLVTLVLDEPPDPSVVALATQLKLELLNIPSSTWRYDSKVLEPRLHSQPPHIVHLHSVFIPKQATLARTLVRHKIPYIITPNAMAPQMLRRGWLKKSLYSWFLEKPRFYAAAALTVVMPKEEESLRAFVPNYQGLVRWVCNPIAVDNSAGQTWNGDIAAKRLVYLGRFDVLHKGIDILVEIARLLPEIQLHLYGSEDVKTKAWLESLQQNLPSNVYFHEPVFGVEKSQVLANASLYIQASRWEAFGISIAEAMYLGVPCAIAETLYLAQLFQEHDLGLVFSATPQEAAAQLSKVLAQPTQLKQWSERGRTFAQENFQAHVCAKRYLEVYDEVLQR